MNKILVTFSMAFIGALVIGIMAQPIGRVQMLRVDEDAGITLAPEDTTASSHLIESGHDTSQYDVHKLWGGNLEDAWCEGAPGSGIGEWVYFDLTHLEGPREVYPASSVAYQKGINELWRILIVNGFAASPEIYYANNRLKRVRVEMSTGRSIILDFRDSVLAYQKFRLDREQATWLKITILEVYRGSNFDDTCIGDVKFEEDNVGYFRKEGPYH